MALKWLEGFETRQHSAFHGRLYTYSGATITSAGTGRRHGTAWRGSNSQFITPVLVPEVENVWVIHFAFRKPTSTIFSSSAPGITLRDAAGIQLELRAVDAAAPDTGGWKFQLMRGATVLASTPVYPHGDTRRAWHVFQLKVTIHTSAGTYELLHYDYDSVETTAIAATTGVNTANQGTDGADRVGFRTGTASNGASDLDDIVILDGTGGALDDFFAAPVTVIGELPNAAGDESDFVPSSGGSNFAMVDDSPTSSAETTEVTASDIGATDLYGFSQADLDLLPTAAPPDVHGIMVDVEAEMKNSGAANLRVEVKDGMDQATDTKDLEFEGASKVSRFAVLEQNPTGVPAAWDVATLKTVQIGFVYDS